MRRISLLNDTSNIIDAVLISKFIKQKSDSLELLNYIYIEPWLVFRNLIWKFYRRAIETTSRILYSQSRDPRLAEFPRLASPRLASWRGEVAFSTPRRARVDFVARRVTRLYLECYFWWINRKLMSISFNFMVNFLAYLLAMKLN